MLYVKQKENRQTFKRKKKIKCNTSCQVPDVKTLKLTCAELVFKGRREIDFLFFKRENHVSDRTFGQMHSFFGHIPSPFALWPGFWMVWSSLMVELFWRPHPIQSFRQRHAGRGEDVQRPQCRRARGAADQPICTRLHWIKQKRTRLAFYTCAGAKCETGPTSPPTTRVRARWRVRPHACKQAP